MLVPSAADLACRQLWFVLSRSRKMQLTRDMAEKSIQLSRRENCGLDTENQLLQNFQHPQIIRHGR